MGMTLDDYKKMSFSDFQAMLQRDREELEALPTPEKIRKEREGYIADLLKVGYLSSDEAERYNKEQLTELPQDRKSLVVAYFLLGVENYKDIVQTTEEYEQMNRVIRSFHLYEKGALQDDTTIADVLTPKEVDRFISELSRVRIEARIKRAEEFVDAKRRRIRGSLLNFFPLLICSSLAEYEKEEELELDPIPNLKDHLKEWGYRGRGKSLNAKDRDAIEKAASYYLDLLELASLNGVGILRYEEYRGLRDNNGAFKSDFIYRDEYDEALTEWECLYDLFNMAVRDFYVDGTARDAIGFLNKYYEKVGGYFAEVLKGTKYNYFSEERKC